MPNLIGGMTTAERLAYLAELREPPRARRDDPETSQAGREGPDDLARLQRDILYVLHQRPNAGLTTGELALALQTPRDSISPRMRTLEARGLIVATTMKRTLPGGRPQIVWLCSRAEEGS
jgi:DNA-binding MarR family transcriptional regulator